MEIGLLVFAVAVVLIIAFFALNSKPDKTVTVDFGKTKIKVLSLKKTHCVCSKRWTAACRLVGKGCPYIRFAFDFYCKDRVVT